MLVSGLQLSVFQGHREPLGKMAEASGQVLGTKTKSHPEKGGMIFVYPAKSRACRLQQCPHDHAQWMVDYYWLRIHSPSRDRAEELMPISRSLLLRRRMPWL